MKHNLRDIGYFLLAILLCAIVGYGVYSYVSYDMSLYKRKYPSTTPFDYWMDKDNHR